MYKFKSTDKKFDGKRILRECANSEVVRIDREGGGLPLVFIKREIVEYAREHMPDTSTTKAVDMVFGNAPGISASGLLIGRRIIPGVSVHGFVGVDGAATTAWDRACSLCRTVAFHKIQEKVKETTVRTYSAVNEHGQVVHQGAG